MSSGLSRSESSLANVTGQGSVLPVFALSVERQSLRTPQSGSCPKASWSDIEPAVAAAAAPLYRTRRHRPRMTHVVTCMKDRMLSHHSLWDQSHRRSAGGKMEECGGRREGRRPRRPVNGPPRGDIRSSVKGRRIPIRHETAVPNPIPRFHSHGTD